MKKSKEKIILDVPLTTKQIDQYKKTAHKLGAEGRDLTRQKNKMLSSFKKKIKEAVSECDYLDAIVKQGFESKEVMADTHINMETGVVKFYYEGVELKKMDYREFRKEREQESIPMQGELGVQ